MTSPDTRRSANRQANEPHVITKDRAAEYGEVIDTPEEGGNPHDMSAEEWFARFGGEHKE